MYNHVETSCIAASSARPAPQSAAVRALAATSVAGAAVDADRGSSVTRRRGASMSTPASSSRRTRCVAPSVEISIAAPSSTARTKTDVAVAPASSTTSEKGDPAQTSVSSAALSAAAARAAPTVGTMPLTVDTEKAAAAAGVAADVGSARDGEICRAADAVDIGGGDVRVSVGAARAGKKRRRKSSSLETKDAPGGRAATAARSSARTARCADDATGAKGCGAAAAPRE